MKQETAKKRLSRTEQPTHLPRTTQCTLHPPTDQNLYYIQQNSSAAVRTSEQLTQARLWSRVHGSVHGSSGHKVIRKFNIVGVRKKKIAGSDEEKAGGGGKRAVPGMAISTLPPRRGEEPTPVLSPACRTADVRMGRGGTARPPEAEWSSGVAAFFGGGFNPDIFKDPKRHDYLHDHLSVLYNKDNPISGL